MSWHRLKIRLGRWIKRLTLIPRVTRRWKGPEVSFWVPHDPLVARSVYEKCQQLFPWGCHCSTLCNLVVGTSRPQPNATTAKTIV